MESELKADGNRRTATRVELYARRYESVPLESLIGAAAAFCTTASYVPQLKKVWTTGETRDLSLKMLPILAAGLALWIIYGLLRGDAAVIAANASA
jgi:MtN3 and saliva related transmembrane protein